MRGTGTERRQAAGLDPRGATQSTTPKALKQITQEATTCGGGRTRERRSTRAGTEEHERIRECTHGCREGMQPGLAMPRPDAGLRSRTFPRAARTGGAAGARRRHAVSGAARRLLVALA